MNSKKVLIIEDDLPTINLFQEAFTMAGLNIEILDTGQKALERLEEIRKGKQEKPSLILLDLILPDMNGIEILKEVRKYPETQDITVYALTNYSDPEFNKKLEAEGINKILGKAQYSLKELINIIKETLT